MTIRRAAERTAQRIGELYTADRVVAFSRAAEESVTQEAKDFITRAIREGIPEGEAGKALSMSVDKVRELSEPWSEAYSRMAFRTNLGDAVVKGKFRQAQDPDIKEVAPAFRYDAVGDGDTRPNHDALDGVVLSVDDPRWARIAPPNGYNCRCTVVLMPIPTLRAAGMIDSNGDLRPSRIPPAGGPDPGFKKVGVKI